MTEDLQRIFPRGRWETNEEFCIPCPYCGDSANHNHCYINVQKKIFHCFLCGEKGMLGRLLEERAGLQKTDEARYSPLGLETKQPPTEILDFNTFFPIPGARSGDNISIGAAARQYLNRRGITDEEIAKYNIRYAVEGRYARRAIAPIREGGKVVCFNARSFTGEEPKYLMPKRGETILTASESIFNYEVLEIPVKTHQTVIITEGIYDAMAINRLDLHGVVGVSTLSKKISKQQARKLAMVRDGRTFMIMFDSPVKDVNISKDISKAAKCLADFSPEMDVQVATLQEGDPDTADPADIFNAIACAKSCQVPEEMMRIIFNSSQRQVHYPRE